MGYFTDVTTDNEIALPISRSEQTPGNKLHTHEENYKIDCGFFLPSWCNKKVNPDRYVPCGSLVGKVGHQVKEILMIQN